METFEAKSGFNYDEITLANPQPVQGGSYFTKLSMGVDKPLYVQLPKCQTKQGIVSTKRGKYSDLMYERRVDSEELGAWIEGIEARCQDLINEKKSTWFHTELSRDDITTMMSPVCRLYRSGTKLLIRTYIDVSRQTDKAKCLAYDEEEINVPLDSLEDERYIIPLVIVDGIKFSSKNFEISIKLAQIMVLDKTEIPAVTCMIKRTTKLEDDGDDQQSSNSEKSGDEVDQKPLELIALPLALSPADDIKAGERGDRDDSSTISSLTQIEGRTADEEVTAAANGQPDDSLEKEDDVALGDSVAVSEDLPTIGEGIEEIHLDYDTMNVETMILKKPNEVYYEIYKAARKKAKHMRQVAVEAYLEAKEIKTKYMLDDVDDSDEDDMDLVSDEENASVTLAEN
jgi:arsenate reductase-like glutaredoxin family protein